MSNDQTVKDATRLLRAFSTNHAEARMVSPHGMDRPFYPSWADAEQAGLNRARREMAETTLHEGMSEERRRREEAERERDELRQALVGRGRRTEAHEEGEERQGRGQPRHATGGAQEGARRPWWRRMLGR